MKEKNTKELNEVLGKTHLSDFEKYCAENKESVSDNSEAFSIYVKNLLQEKKLTQQYVFSALYYILGCTHTKPLHTHFCYLHDL